MSQKIITLSGAATDVLYALFFRGALQSGDLPSKSGADELRELGFAESRHTATKYQEKNFFTFLTAEGQEFAIKHLVNTNFGVPAGGYIGRPLDTLDEIAELPRYKISNDYAIQQKIADALDTALARHNEQFGSTEPEKTAVVFLVDRWVAIEGSYTPEEIREGVEYIKRYRLSKKLQKSMEDISPFVMKDGEVFIKDAYIQGGAIQSVSISDTKKSDHSSELKSKSDDCLMKSDDEHDPVSFKNAAYRFQGDPLPFGGFPGPAVISAKQAVDSSDTKYRLSDDMREAVIDAVRNSEVFQSLVEQVNAQSAAHASTALSLQMCIDRVVKDTISNALKPGGLLFGKS